MFGVVEPKLDPREGVKVARKRYGQTIRMHQELHRDVNQVAAYYEVPAQDVYQAICSDRAAALIARMWDERQGKKPKGSFASVMHDEFGVTWARPARGAASAVEQPASPEPERQRRRPRGG